MHGRPLAGIDHAHLDEGIVRRQAHFPAQGVHLPHQMPLGGAADGRVAGHQRHRVQVDGQTQGAVSHPGESQRCLATRVPRSQHDGVIVSRSVGLHTFSLSRTPAPAIRQDPHFLPHQKPAWSRRFSQEAPPLRRNAFPILSRSIITNNSRLGNTFFISLRSPRPCAVLRARRCYAHGDIRPTAAVDGLGR